MVLSLWRGRRQKAQSFSGGKVGMMKIADVLRETEEAVRGETCSCNDGRKGWKVSSPIWVFSRWALSARLAGDGRSSGCCVFMGGKKGAVDVVVADAGVDYSSSCSSDSGSPEEVRAAEGAVRCSSGGGVLGEEKECGVAVKELEINRENQSGSGNRPDDDVSFSLGLGVGLIFVLARSRSILNKMVEMRKEVKDILEEVKEAVHRKDLICGGGSMESKNHLTFTATDSCEDANPSHLTHQPLPQDRSPFFQITETPAEHEERSSGSMECSHNLDKLQQEFESEMEQLQMGMHDDHHEYPHPEVEMAGRDGDASEGSEEDFDPKGNGEQEIDESCQYGVCPHDLERRLHELVQTRQQERIEELETALRRAEQKLREKEMEIRWWSDAAQIVTRQHSGGVCR